MKGIGSSTMPRRKANPILSPLPSSVYRPPRLRRKESHPLDVYSKALALPSLAEENRAKLLSSLLDLQNQYHRNISDGFQALEEHSVANDSIGTSSSFKAKPLALQRLLFKIGKALTEHHKSFHYSRGQEFSLSITEAMEFFLNSLQLQISPSDIKVLSQRFAASDEGWNIDMSKSFQVIIYEN